MLEPGGRTPPLDDPLRKGAQYEEIRKLGKGDHLVKLKTSPQARKSGRDWEMR